MRELYHFTDTARLPWIIRSGELRPGRNKAGGFPDPDFLWASSLAIGDRSASATTGEAYRDGTVWHVRFTLREEDFFPWSEAPDRFPVWTPEHVTRLEVSGGRMKAHPDTWWCRSDPLPLSRILSIHVRSYQNNRWKLIPLPGSFTRGESAGVVIGDRVFASREFQDPRGVTGYEVARVAPMSDAALRASMSGVARHA